MQAEVVIVRAHDCAVNPWHCSYERPQLSTARCDGGAWVLGFLGDHRGCYNAAFFCHRLGDSGSLPAAAEALFTCLVES